MKGVSLLLSLIAIASAGASGYFFFNRAKHENQLSQELVLANGALISAQQRATDAATERDNLAGRLALAERESTDLKSHNTTLEARNNQLSRDLTQIRQQLTLREQTDQGASAELNDLRRRLADAQSAAAVAVSGATPEEVANYESKIDELEHEVASLRKGDSLVDRLASVPVDLHGSVIEVGPKSAFVVLNIGTRNGAVPSLEMTLRRGNDVIARVRLTDVRDSYSVAHVVPLTNNGSIHTGDLASRS